MKMSRCERRCEDEQMFRRCEDEKMFYRPPLLEEPCAQKLSGKNATISALLQSSSVRISEFQQILSGCDRALASKAVNFLSNSTNCSSSFAIFAR